MDILINIIGGKSTKVCSFDISEETKRREPWTGNDTENKKMLDTFIQGGNYVYTDSRGVQTIRFGQGLYQYRNRKFTESLGEGDDDSVNSGLVNSQKKRVIIYTLKN